MVGLNIKKNIGFIRFAFLFIEFIKDNVIHNV